MLERRGILTFVGICFRREQWVVTFCMFVSSGDIFLQCDTGLDFACIMKKNTQNPIRGKQDISYYMKNTIVQMTKHIIRVCFRVEINHKIETKRSALCSRPVILLQYIYAANIHTFRKGPCLRKIRQCPIGAFHASSAKEWNKKLSSGSLFDSEIHRFQFTKLQTSAVLEKLEWTWLDFK